MTWHNARRPFRSLTLCPSSLVSGGKFSLNPLPRVYVCHVQEEGQLEEHN